MRALAVSRFATASHQRRSPDSILKISREGTIHVHLPIWDTSFYQVALPNSVPFETVVPRQLFGNAAPAGRHSLWRARDFSNRLPPLGLSPVARCRGHR